jgi:hypothetical protein
MRTRAWRTLVLLLLAPALQAQIQATSPDLVVSTSWSQFPPISHAWAEHGESLLLTGAGNLRRVDASGAPVDLGLALHYPAVLTPDVQDGTQACWTQSASGGAPYAVQCQRFLRDFTPRTGVTHIAFQTINTYGSETAASDPRGNLVVAWRDQSAVRFRLWYSTGDLGPVTPAFDGIPMARVLALRFPDGHFTLLAHGAITPAALWAHSFSLVGAPLGPPTQLANATPYQDDQLLSAATGGGRVALLWQRRLLADDSRLTYVGFYDEHLVPQGNPQAREGAIEVGCDALGRCLVSAFAGVQVYDAQGAPGQFIARLTNSAYYADIGVCPSGDFALTWASTAASRGLQPVAPHLPEPVLWGLHVMRFGGAPKGDLDASGLPDILLQNVTTRAVEVWPMNGATRSLPPRTLDTLPGAGWHVVGSDDFDGDWRQDIVLWNDTSGALEIWYLGGTDGTTRLGQANVSGATPPAPASGWRVVATGDFDANGWPDLLWSRQSDGLLQVWSLKNAVYQETLTTNPAQAVDTNWRVVAALDFDNDGRRDLLWYNVNSGRIVFWYLDGGLQRVAGRFATPPAAGDNNWTVVAAGDWGNGSGAASVRAKDLLWRNATTGRLVMWHLDPTGTRIAGSFTSPDAPTDALSWSVVGPR